MKQKLFNAMAIGEVVHDDDHNQHIICATPNGVKSEYLFRKQTSVLTHWTCIECGAFEAQYVYTEPPVFDAADYKRVARIHEAIRRRVHELKVRTVAAQRVLITLKRHPDELTNAVANRMLLRLRTATAEMSSRARQIEEETCAFDVVWASMFSSAGDR